MIADQYHEGERNMNNCNNTSEAVKNKAIVEELVAVHNTNNNNDDNTNF